MSEWMNEWMNEWVNEHVSTISVCPAFNEYKPNRYMPTYIEASSIHMFSFSFSENELG